MRRPFTSFPFLALLLVVAAACSTDTSAPGEDGGTSNVACVDGTCPDGLFCRSDQTCVQSLACTGSLSSYCAGGSCVSTYATAEQMCASATAAQGYGLVSFPCGGYLYFTECQSGSCQVFVYPETGGDLQAVYETGTTVSCTAGTANVSSACVLATEVAEPCPLPPPDAGGEDAGGGSGDAGNASDSGDSGNPTDASDGG